MLLDIYTTVTSVIPYQHGDLQQTAPCPMQIAGTLYGWGLWATEPSSRDILRHIMRERRGHENPSQMAEVVKALMREPLYGDLVAWGKLSHTLAYSRTAMNVTTERGDHRYVWNMWNGAVPGDIQMTDENGAYMWKHPVSEWWAMWSHPVAVYPT